MPAGRPEGTTIIPEFDDEKIKKVEFLTGAGFRVEDIAGYFGVSRATFYRYMDNDPRIVEALEKGRVSINAGVAGSLYKNAMAGNVVAQMFWLKTRARWREQAPEAEQDSFKLAYADEPLDE